MHTSMESIAALTFNQMPIMEIADANNNSSSGSAASGSDEAAKKDEKYSLRQRQSRRSTQTAKQQEKKSSVKEKPKTKAAPLSKYRRKTANARERTRMREINSAFETLRKAVPVAVAGTSGNSSPVSSPSQMTGAGANEKLTKITTLRLAMKYIRILRDILDNTDSSLIVENNNDMDMINHNEIEREVMLKGALLNEALFNAVSPQSVVNHAKKSPSRKSNATSSASTSKQKPKKASKSTTPKKSTSTRSKRTKSKQDDKTRSPQPANDLVDLGMMLDSDNDSLNLSEPCLSPLQTSGLKQTFNSCNTSATNDLEFGLFLESDADSLQLSEPCLSPLSHLDSLNPFNDLLHTGFNEQTALELYL